MRKRTLYLDGEQYVKPLIILAGCCVLVVVLDRGRGTLLNLDAVFSTFQGFALIGLVALGLGLTMVIEEFDLSVIGIFSLSGCIAVLTGVSSPWLGLGIALLTCTAIGLVQGLIIVRFQIDSVAVTLGGLLTTIGAAYVLTGSRELPYPNMSVALWFSDDIARIFSIRSLVTVAVFIVAAVVVGYTRLGRDMVAAGSNRRGAETAGVNVDGIVTGLFAFSAFCAAFAGAMLSYSMASASPAALSDILVPAAAAAILGGVSLGGGMGRPLGIAMGVLALSVLRSGLNAVGAPPYINEITMSLVLMLVAIFEGSYLAQRLGTSIWPRRARSSSPALPTSDRNR
jgi:ribose/xylose/arabinose/galactoside ABC-type transport system permease subunit